MTQNITNIAGWVPAMAALQPDRPAIFYPLGRDPDGKRQYSHYTFEQLDRASNHIAAGLEQVGIGRGTRTVLMVKPSREFFALVFALFKVGAVLVLVDPGIGIKNLGICLGRAQPEAFVGIPAAHVARLMMGWSRATLRTFVTVGPRLFWGGHTLAQVKALGASRPDYQMAQTGLDDHAAILFTSGSTGPSKGAIYTHRNFLAQVDAIREMYDIRPGEIDLPTFPLFALFAPALGMTAVIPDMDFTRPAKVDPRLIIEAIEDFGVTTMFGSPALLNTVGRWAEKNGVRVRSVRRVISAGAPMQAHILRRWHAMLPEGALIHPPYGATESLPVATMNGHEILAETWAATQQGRGACVGRPVNSIEVRVVAITDGVLSESAATPLEAGSIGEICVRGDQVTQGYFNDPDNTARSKITCADGTFWHRMGDLGYLDPTGRLWFCGRKSHRVRAAGGDMYTIPCEGIFNAVPGVFRTALVGVGPAGQQVPVLCIERETEASAAGLTAVEVTDAALLEQLKQRGAQFDLTRGISHFLFHPGFPVDIRHNAKIGREQLAQWAAQQLRGKA